MEITTLKLPSNILYNKENQDILVTYLTTKNELNVFNLTNEDNLLYDFLINNLIVNKEKFNVDDLLLCDLFTLMLFAFSTSYSDEINFKIICRQCEKESEISLKISEDINFDYEEFNIANNEIISFGNTYFKLKPINYKIIKIMNFKLSDINYNNSRFISSHLNFYLEEELKEQLYDDRIFFTDEIRPIKFIEEKQEINNIIKLMPISQYNKLKELVRNIDLKIKPIKRKCMYCGSENEINIDYSINLFRFDDNFKEGVLTEMFFLLQNMTNISYNDILDMPVYVRKWFVNKTIEYIEKMKEEQKGTSIPGSSYISKANNLLNKIKI